MDATNEFEEKFSRIVDLLEEHLPAGLTVKAVAEKLGIPRNSASKYLQLLASSGDVSVERYGQKKFYRPLQRIPLPEIFDHLPNALVVLDGDLHVRMMNASFVAVLGILPGRNIIGTPLFDLNLPIFGEPSVRRNIERIRQSQTYIADMDLIEEASDRIYRVEFNPVAMQFGRPGIMVSLRDITERLKTETELKDSKRKVATLFETVPNGIVMFATDGSILDANPAALQILGLQTFEELSAASVFDLSCAPGRMESLIRRGRTDDTELACDFDRMKRDRGIPTTKSGVAFLNVVFTPIRPDSGGPPTEFAILFKDITAKKRAEKELKQRLEGISNNLPGIVYQFYARDTGEWGMYYVDKRCADICGLSLEPITDWLQRWTACLPPEDRDRWRASIEDAISRFIPWEYEGWFLKPTGGRMYFRGISQPVRLKSETVWNGIFFDVTDRRQAEEALRVSNSLETRYRSFFEDTCNGVLIYEPVDGGRDFVILDVNRAVADLLRMEREELIGKRLFEEFPDLPAREISEVVMRVLATGRPEVAPPVRYRDRDDFPWVSRYVFRLPSGELASFMIDVSDELREDGGTAAARVAGSPGQTGGSPGPVRSS